MEGGSMIKTWSEFWLVWAAGVVLGAAIVNFVFTMIKC